MYVHTYINSYIYICVFMYVYIYYMYMYTYIYIYTYTSNRYICIFCTSRSRFVNVVRA